MLGNYKKMAIIDISKILINQTTFDKFDIPINLNFTPKIAVVIIRNTGGTGYLKNDGGTRFKDENKNEIIWMEFTMPNGNYISRSFKITDLTKTKIVFSTNGSIEENYKKVEIQNLTVLVAS